MELKFFISYSRDDGDDFAQQWYNHLKEKDISFMDTTSINVKAK